MIKQFRDITIIVFSVISIFIPDSHIYAQLRDTDKVKLKEYLDKAINYTNEGKNFEAANYYYKSAVLCLERNDKEKALPYFKESARLNLSVKRLNETKKIYSNIGLIYSNLGDYDKSLKYFSSSQKIRISLGKKEDIASGFIDIAYVYLVQGKNKESIMSLVKALDIATEIKHVRLIMICYKLMAENYNSIGDVSKTEDYRNKYESYKELVKTKSIKEDQEKKNIENLVELAKVDAEKKAKDLELKLIIKDKTLAADEAKRREEILQDSIRMSEVLASKEKTEKDLLTKKNSLKEAELKQAEERRKNQNTIIIAGIGFIILVVAIAVILVINFIKSRKHSIELEHTNKEIERQKKNIEEKNIALTSAFLKIEEQNKDIAQSIDYARGIQKAILPKQDNLNNFIKDSFILFEPRDKVSGDFFWFHEDQIMNGGIKPNKKVFVSAIDCTGHGVPGALLAMVSYNILDSLVSQKKNYKPSIILDELHTNIRKTLRQDKSDNVDGMDMALCTYSPEKNILEFAGAKNPLFYIKDNKFHKIKGDIKPIGGMHYEKTERMPFKNHKVVIDKPTTFYIFSDGYADQIGESTGRKFMTKKFSELILKIHQLPMHEQKATLKEIFEEWKGTSPQVDDVMVIGFKLFPK